MGDVAWQQRKGWETPLIRSNAKRRILMTIAFTLLWNGLTLFGFDEQVYFFKHWDTEDKIFLLFSLFSIVGVGLIIWSTMLVLEYRRFGVIAYEMDPYPGSIGGHVGGKIHLGHLPASIYQKVEMQDCFTLTLACIKSHYVKNRDGQRREEFIKWSEQGKPLVVETGAGYELQFYFDVPDDLPAADVEQKADSYFFWRLSLDGDVPGVDLSRHYNIPVYPTGEFTRSVHHDVSEQNRQQDAERIVRSRQAMEAGDIEATAIAETARIQWLGDELSLYFPMFRNRMAAGLIAIFAVGFGVVGGGVLSLFDGWNFFGVVAGLVAIPMALISLAASIMVLYLLLTHTRLTVRDRQVDVHRRWLFFTVKDAHLTSSQIASLGLHNSSSIGQGGQVQKKYYRLYAILADGGEQVFLTEGICGEAVAEQFKAYVIKRLQLSCD